MDDLLNQFLIETSDRLADLDAEIAQFPSAPGDVRTRARLADLLHTIKGTSSFLVLPRLEAIAQSAEDLLGKVEAGALPATAEFAAAVVGAIDVVRPILRGLAIAGREPDGDDSALLDRLRVARTGGTGASAFVPVLPPPAPDATAATPEEVPTKLDVLPTAPSIGSGLSMVPIPVDRLESFAGLVGQLVQTRNNLNHLISERDDPELEDSLQRLSHITSDLGTSIIATRRQALGPTAAEMPGTFDIVTAVTVACATQRYAIPQRNILELVWVTPVAGMGTANDEFRFLRLREQRYPWVRLSTLLKINMDQSLARRREIVIMMQVGGEAIGLSVEQVFDAEEIVLRPQPPLLRDIPLFSGNAVLGDGSIAMMLDPAGILAELKNRQQAAIAARAAIDGPPLSR
jgi:chemotaxis protein histidine kinase CheA